MNRMFLIWSEEHGCWWRPASYDGTTWGYTHSIVEAGRYTEEAANAIVVKANEKIHPGEGFNPGRTFNETKVPDPCLNYWISEEQLSRLGELNLEWPDEVKEQEKLLAEVRSQILDQDSEP